MGGETDLVFRDTGDLIAEVVHVVGDENYQGGRIDLDSNLTATAVSLMVQRTCHHMTA